MSIPKLELNIDTDSLKKIKWVAVAYSHVDEALFANKEAFDAQKEVEERAQQIMGECRKLGLESKGYPVDQYLLTNILVDRPDVIVNLVDTVRGKDKLASTIPAFLENANIPYTGCGTTGMDQLARAVCPLAPNARIWFKEKASFEDLEFDLHERKFPVGVEWQGLFDVEDYGHYTLQCHRSH
ncbi:MAG: hypothetical protein ABI621_07535 [Chloroflexota bacterium]